MFKHKFNHMNKDTKYVLRCLMSLFVTYGMKWHFIVQGCTMDYRVDWTQGSCGFWLLAKFWSRSSLISTIIAKWQQLEECSLVLCNKTSDVGGLGWDENEWLMNFFGSPQLHKLIRRVISAYLKHFWVR